jgi:transcription elongation factor GreA
VHTPATTAQRAETPLVTPERATVDLAPASGLGSTVEAEDLATGARLIYRLVEAHHAAPKEGRLSIESPVGMVLRARRCGEVVTATTPRGHRRLRIISVT